MVENTVGRQQRRKGGHVGAFVFEFVFQLNFLVRMYFFMYVCIMYFSMYVSCGPYAYQTQACAKRDLARPSGRYTQVLLEAGRSLFISCNMKLFRDFKNKF